MLRWDVRTLARNSMKLSPFGNIFLGATLIALGVLVLAEFSLMSAMLYVSAVFLSVLLFF